MSAGTRLPIADARRIGRELRELSGGHRRALVLVAVVGLAGAAAGLLVPVAIGELVDAVADGSASTSTWLWTTLAMTTAAVLSALGNAVSIRLAARGYQTVLAGLRERLVATAMRLPQHRVEQAGTGDLISRSSDDVAQIGDAAAALVPAFTPSICATVVTLAGTAVIDWRYGTALLVMVPIYLLAVRWYLRVAPEVYRAERAAMSERAQQIIESARGRTTITGFGLGEHRHRRVLDASWTVTGPALRARTVQNMFLARLFAAQYAGLGVVLVTGFWMIGTGHSTIGDATAATLILIRLFGPLTQLLLVFDTVQSVLASLGRIVGVIALNGINDTNDTATAPEDGAVRAERIGFAYPGGPLVLDGVDLTIPTGQRLAVVGASGAGKSTLASVIAGIHPPDSGVVIRPDHTVVVTQETHVFAGTLRDNLTLTNPAATDEQLRAALRATGAAELADTLPDGLDALVGATGQDLTPAQIQQIALTRILLADPDLAIFDEATAEAGSTQAGLLDHAADIALTGRTAMVIAHRLSQAAACDRIAVMEHGRITETGTHSELIAAGGVYATLWSTWRAGQEGVAGS